MKTIFSVLLFGVTAFIWYGALRTGDANLLSWHMICMSTSYLILMYQALMLLNNPGEPKPRQQKVDLHGLLQILAVIGATSGFILIYLAKNSLGYAHFQSSHAFWGLMTFCGTWGAVIGGVAANNAAKLKLPIKPAVIKFIHANAGTVVYSMAMASFTLIVLSSWWEQNFGNLARYAVLAAVGPSTLFALRSPIVNVKRRFKGAFKRSAD